MPAIVALQPTVASLRDVKIRSRRPYCIASSADRKLSRSVSRAIRSIVWPVCLAMISFSLARRYRISLAWISTSEACPWKPPIGWWIMTREFGRQKRLSLSPAASSSAPMRAAWRVDVEEDVLVRVLGLEKQHLRDDQIGGHLRDRTDQEHHPLLE